MRYFYLAPEDQLSSIYTTGIKADKDKEIKIIALQEDFLMDKYIFDIYAYEILGIDVYCLFHVLNLGFQSEILDGNIKHIFAPVFKRLKQDKIERKFIAPYKSLTNYEGMGLVEGVFPVENKDKFTDEYKQKILEYLLALGK
ncbi:MAG: hypothetical protein MUF15_21245 [Acidobacteria bacterium]|jgi:hypothetical protein|nr:hypothetical protein [Acidobacteriota bacterium]